MGDFKQGGGKRFFGNRKDGFDRQDTDRPAFARKNWGQNHGPATMHKATCAKCGNDCEVPFRPFEGRQVYCAACFQGKKEIGDRGNDRFAQKSFGGYKSFNRPDFKTIPGRENNDEIKKQLEILNSKIDRLIRAMEGMTNSAPATEEKNMEPGETTPTSRIKKVKKVFKKRKSK